MSAKRFLALFLVIPLIISEAYGASIDFGEDCGSPGDTVTIPVTLNYIEGETPNICSIGIDIGFDPDVLENPQVEIGPAGSDADKDIFSNIVSPGLLRMGILGYNQNIISAGIVANVTFTIKADAPYGTYTLTNTPSASDPDGNAISVTGADGIVSISCPSAVNHPPIAQEQTVSTDQNTPVDVTLLATDADNDLLTYSIVSYPSHGTLDITGIPKVTYTPDPDYTGTDSFTFKANDGEADSNAATVSITVTLPTGPRPAPISGTVTTNCTVTPGTTSHDLYISSGVTVINTGATIRNATVCTGATIVGGTLERTIENFGTLRDVTIAEDAKVEGGKLKGIIKAKLKSLLKSFVAEEDTVIENEGIIEGTAEAPVVLKKASEIKIMPGGEVRGFIKSEEFFDSSIDIPAGALVAEREISIRFSRPTIPGFSSFVQLTNPEGMLFDEADDYLIDFTTLTLSE